MTDTEEKIDCAVQSAFIIEEAATDAEYLLELCEQHLARIMSIYSDFIHEDASDAQYYMGVYDQCSSLIKSIDKQKKSMRKSISKFLFIMGGDDVED